ncbi:uncharacterized protein [Panulirus ornatus]|uniref:uncharacterized protein isoform X2 n=1 Tax=Panulirus ornatus TaxID=150431 RepID=UPI003A8C692E
MEGFFWAAIGLCPALVMLLTVTVFRNASAVYTVMLVTITCASIAFAFLRWRLSCRPKCLWRTQTDDVESGNGTSGDEENNNMDAPPVYETVVSKPPPYEYLYVSACGDDPPPSSAVPSSAATPETDGVLRQGEGPNATEQGCPDPDLPSYADIVGNPASPE